MKRKGICFLLFVLAFCFVFSLEAYAVDNEHYKEQLESSGATELLETLSKEDKELLKKLGIDTVDFDSVFSSSPRKVFDLIYQLIRNEYTSPIKCGFALAAMLIFLSVAGQFVSGEDKVGKTVGLVAVLAAGTSVIVPLAQCLTRAISAIEASSNFMITLIPVLAAVITVSGNPTLALTYNTLAFSVAQVNSMLAKNVIRPIIQVTLSLSIISTVADTVNFEKLVDFIKKACVFLMSLSATVFITMLSIKGMLAAAADTVTVRGVRFLIGNLIPVVGGAVSDAYSSIVGSLHLVKNTVAAFAVAAVVVINLPVLAECICWIAVLNLTATLGDMLSQDRVSKLLRAVASGVTLLAVTLVFSLVVIVLTIGLILVIKGGG